jgi:hypothetical protein
MSLHFICGRDTLQKSPNAECIGLSNATNQLIIEKATKVKLIRFHRSHIC